MSLQTVSKIENKKGGPYPKIDREERRDEVYKLHFEFGYSAVRISELLNFNRNTINEDINYWYDQLSHDVNYTDLKSLILKTFERLELQRSRFYEYVMDKRDLSAKIKLEQSIFNIDCKISNLAYKLIRSNMPSLNVKVKTNPENS